MTPAKADQPSTSFQKFGSVPSHDRKGVVCLEYATELLKPSTN